MKQSRKLNHKDLHYDKISEVWSDHISDYDTNRRMQVLIGELLGADRIRDAVILDGGCGLGYFTAELLKYKPKKLVSVDISSRLIEKNKKKYPDAEFLVADLLDLSASLSDQDFDIVLSSDVIEHTPDPLKAVDELCARVKKGGILIVSVPNQRWHWLLRLANSMGLRKKYQGYENWLLPNQLTERLVKNGFEIIKKQGIHLIPWQGIPKKLLTSLDRVSRPFSYSYSINLAVKAVKK